MTYPRFTLCAATTFIASTLIAAIVISAPSVARASYILYQIDDQTDVVQARAYQDGVLFQSNTYTNETHIVDNLVTNVSNFQPNDLIATIYEFPGGPVSDAMQVGGRGFGAHIDFYSDSETSQAPNLGGLQIIEDGTFQSIGTFTDSQGNLLEFQFRSDVEVPEPSTFILSIAGIAGLRSSTPRKKFRRA